MESVGVEAGESLDEAGKSRFFSNSPMSLFYKLPLINRFHWYWHYIWHKHGVVSPSCCFVERGLVAWCWGDGED